MNCQMVFGINMDLTIKSRFVAGFNYTETLASATYTYVVSRDIVSVEILLSAMNYSNAISMYIQGVCLNTSCEEKLWFRAGAEFGSRKGLVINIFRYLYGLKISRAT